MLINTSIKSFSSVKIEPEKVHETLSKHMLVDGFDMVVDLQKSNGSKIWDSRNKRYFLDFFTFFASSPIGLNHPKLLTDEFKEKLLNVSINKPTNSDVYTVEMAEFVETFSRVAIPKYLKYLFLVEGGTLGNENGLKAAFDWKIRKNFKKGYKEEKGTQVLHFTKAFHGRSGYTLSLTNTNPIKTMYYPKFKWPRITAPIIEFPLNEINLEKVKKLEEQAINEIKEAIRNNPDDIAVMIIEPIQGEGGDNHFRKEFFIELRTLCDENDIMLMFDEVQTGIGLTGKMWAHQHFVQPDIMSFGKKTQVCGCLVSEKIDEVEDNVFHVSSRINSTWGGNLTDMVRFTKYLEVIEEENLVQNAEIVGKYLLEKLIELGNEFPNKIRNIRGRGLMCAIDFNSPQERDIFKNKCYDNGIVILGCGEQTIRFRPALNLTKEEVDEGLEIMKKVLMKM
ncbi:MAG TPA: L-lysine 6-transaminase [Bacteroidota bacterium]|jgi:L-lysine 6-transaminase|nr:L-lysine 6-transaminase [Bacteroidota bacterium]